MAYTEAMEHAITSQEQLKELWTLIYRAGCTPDWSHIIPYYSPDIHFRDSVQELHGIKDFAAMTRRLARRSGSLSMEVTGTAQEGRVIFLEWVMTLQYKKYPTSAVHGCSKVTLDERGKIIRQRDYYDLWGDIFDNIPGFGRLYRRFMRSRFG